MREIIVNRERKGDINGTRTKRQRRDVYYKRMLREWRKWMREIIMNRELTGELNDGIIKGLSNKAGKGDVGRVERGNEETAVDRERTGEEYGRTWTEKSRLTKLENTVAQKWRKVMKKQG